MAVDSGDDRPVLKVANLHLWRGERHVLRGVSFEIGAGEALHVSGPNGAGKTSLLRVICGLLQAEEGEVRWNSVPTRAANSAFLDSLAYLAHHTALKGDLTATENLRFSVGLKRPLADENLRAVLGEMGVAGCADLPCRVLSAGQSRRVALCRILLSDARFWVLDEPFTNLDTASSAHVAAALQAHLEHGGLALIAAHQGLNLPERAVRRLELA
jgi:heme exporter protein A